VGSQRALEFEFPTPFKFINYLLTANCQIFASCQHKVNLTSFSKSCFVVCCAPGLFILKELFPKSIIRVLVKESSKLSAPTRIPHSFIDTLYISNWRIESVCDNIIVEKYYKDVL
jgi:hypothetical protein